MRKYSIEKILLWIGAAFFLSEAVIHAFGLPILEHDKIFQVTSDLYIALFAATYGALLILISTDPQKYRELFFVTMAGIALAMAAAAYIAAGGGYARFFPVRHLDSEIDIIGRWSLVWYPLAWLAWWKRK